MILVVITKRVKKGETKEVRESYSFKSVLLLFGLAADIVAAFTRDWSPWSIIAALLNLEAEEPLAALIIDKVLVVVVFIICCVVVCKTHSQWSGEISRRQYRLNMQEMNDSSLFRDFAVYLNSLMKQNYELKNYQKFLGSTAYEENYITNELPWHIEFARIFSIMSNQVSIHPGSDWHASNHCFISPYAEKYMIAIYCSIEMPGVSEVAQFLTYIHQFNQRYSSQIIAVKNNPGNVKDYTVFQDILGIQYMFKDNMLDNLVDFTEYFRAIDTLYNRPLLQGTNQKLEDVYVEPNYTIGQNFSEVQCQLHSYVVKWLLEDSCRQLALLGDFGQGKTLFATYLTYLMIKLKFHRIPILIHHSMICL